MPTNYYRILDLPYNASVADVKRAYREKAKSCHPDVSRSAEAKKEFQLLNQAYSVLSNNHSRRKYDLLLFYRYSVLKEHYRKREQRAQKHQKSARKSYQARGTTGQKMTSTTRGYRYYKPDPPSIFKFGIYTTGILFGSSLFVLTTISLLTNGWPIVSAFLLVPATIVTYQGWQGMNEHRNDAGKNFLVGWRRFLKSIGAGKKERL